MMCQLLTIINVNSVAAKRDLGTITASLATNDGKQANIILLP